MPKLTQPLHLLLAGPQGVGKGTQAKLLAEILGLIHLSSGDLFRENIANETGLGRLAKSFMDKGELVPDDVTIDMIRERLSQPDAKLGAIFDGFPRTVPQAEALDKTLVEMGSSLRFVINLIAPDTLVIERLAGRLTCSKCGRVYHITNNPPKAAGLCDLDKSQLVQRSDDTKDAIKKRLATFHAEMERLVPFYEKSGSRIFDVDATGPIESVTKELLLQIRWQLISDK